MRKQLIAGGILLMLAAAACSFKIVRAPAPVWKGRKNCRDAVTGRFVSCSLTGEPLGMVPVPRADGQETTPHCYDDKDYIWPSHGECD